MKSFLIELTFFLAIIFFTVQGVKLVTPFYWGNPDLGKKLAFFENNTKNFNSIFIGSSGIYRQVDPRIINDSTDYYSFNLGADAMFYLESEYILENFLKLYQKPWNIFLSESNIHFINENNLHTVRGKYFMDFKRMKKGVLYHWKKGDYHQVKMHLIAFFENQMGLGELKGLAFFWMNRLSPLNEIIKEQQGYYAMDQQFGNANSKSEKKGAEVRMNKTEIENYPFPVNNISSKMIEQQNLPELHRYYQIPWSIPLGSAFLYDDGHLNYEGGQIYSKKIADALKSL